MRIKSRKFGHHFAQDKIVKKDIIKTQNCTFTAESLLEAAQVSLLMDAVSGTGPLSSVLKSEAKKLAEKFAKANPQFEFSVFGRRYGSKNPEGAAKPGPKTTKETTKPKKAVEKKKSKKK